MSIEIFVKGGEYITATREVGGVKVSVEVEKSTLLNEVEVQSDGKKHGTLYINKNNNAQWCEEKN